MTTKKELDPAGAAVLERVVLTGDLAQLSAVDRVIYYRRVCESLGLNPLTKPFSFLRLNQQLQLYPNAECAEQLRAIHGVSVKVVSVGNEGDLFIVRVEATTPAGRTDSDLAAVPIANLKGELLANMMMKAVTKAKRRVTLSICGLAWPDTGEMETVPGAQVVPINPDTGELEEEMKPNGNGKKLADLTERLAKATASEPDPPSPTPQPDPPAPPDDAAPSSMERALLLSRIFAVRDRDQIAPGVFNAMARGSGIANPKDFDTCDLAALADLVKVLEVRRKPRP
jgi:hypothetical protein